MTQGKHAWVEKYRPRTLDDVAHQEEAVHALQHCVQSGDLPHLLFYGPPGTGKTSTILAMAHQLFGPSKFRDRVLELNASDERGIQVIREKVKSFAQRAVGSAGSDGYPCPPFKIVILDEADSMTSDAQTALRRTMETYSHVTRFCIVCNYVSRIIDPLTSRCAKFRFKPLPVAAMKARLARIAEAEGVRLQDDVLAALIESSEGDLRRAIKYLESLFHLCEKGITKHDVFDMSGQVPPSIVVNLLDGILGKNFDDLEKRVANVVADGYAAGQLLSQLLDLSMSHESFSELGVARVAERIAAADQALNDGADDYLQLLDVCSFAMSHHTDK